MTLDLPAGTSGSGAPAAKVRNPAGVIGLNVDAPASSQAPAPAASLALPAPARERPRWGSGLVVPLAILALALIAMLFPQLLATHDPFADDVRVRLQPPSPDHWFGTDELGRDLYSRVIFGASESLSVSLIGLAIAVGLSLIIGVLAGYLRGWVDQGLMMAVNVLLAVPSILVSLLIVTGLGTGPENLALAVGLASVPAFARLVRAEVLRVSTRPFVEAARTYGLPWWRILGRHILPHTRGPVAALLALEFASIVLSVSTLSFLGYGTQPPQPEWGNLIAAGRQFFQTAWWLTVAPGAVLAVTILALHRVGRSLGRAAGGAVV